MGNRAGSSPVARTNKKVPFVYQTKGTFLSDAFLAERDAHCVRDAGFACDARLRRVGGTHRITYHSTAASPITQVRGTVFQRAVAKRVLLQRNGR